MSRFVIVLCTWEQNIVERILCVSRVGMGTTWIPLLKTVYGFAMWQDLLHLETNAGQQPIKSNHPRVTVAVETLDSCSFGKCIFAQNVWWWNSGPNRALGAFGYCWLATRIFDVHTIACCWTCDVWVYKNIFLNIALTALNFWALSLVTKQKAIVKAGCSQLPAGYSQFSAGSSQLLADCSQLLARCSQPIAPVQHFQLISSYFQ